MPLFLNSWLLTVPFLCSLSKALQNPSNQWFNCLFFSSTAPNTILQNFWMRNHRLKCSFYNANKPLLNFKMSWHSNKLSHKCFPLKTVFSAVSPVVVLYPISYPKSRFSSGTQNSKYMLPLQAAADWTAREEFNVFLDTELLKHLLLVWATKFCKHLCPLYCGVSLVYLLLHMNSCWTS